VCFLLPTLVPTRVITEITVPDMEFFKLYLFPLHSYLVCIINRARGACRHSPGDEVLSALHRRLQREEGHRGDPAEEVPRAHQRADGGEVAAAPRRLLQRTQPSTRVPPQVQVWKIV
jgi:hypothetical protein